MIWMLIVLSVEVEHGAHWQMVAASGVFDNMDFGGIEVAFVKYLVDVEVESVCPIGVTWSDGGFGVGVCHPLGFETAHGVAS